MDVSSGSVCLAFVSHANLKLEGNPDSGCGVSGSGAASGMDIRLLSGVLPLPV